jgi:hypothetical protein
MERADPRGGPPSGTRLRSPADVRRPGRWLKTAADLSAWLVLENVTVTGGQKARLAALYLD